jgi:hypothetical protein
MANTYQWIVTNMECYPQDAGQTNVVYKAYYYVEAFSSETHEVDNLDGSKNTIPYQATYASEQDFTYTTGSPFTPFNELTNDIVVRWIQSALGTENVDAIIAKLDKQIADQINPSVITPPLPWGSA